MVVILRSDNYHLAQQIADELKKSISNVVLTVDNEKQMFIISVEETDLEEAQILVRKIAKSITKDFKIVGDNSSDDWENNQLSQSYDKSNGLFENFIGNFKRIYKNSGIVTLTITIICIVFFLLDMFGFKRDVFSIFSMVGFMAGEPETWYKLVTPVFIHGGITHIVFNLVMWIFVGKKIEKYLSHVYLLLVFIIGSIIPNFIQYVFYGPMFCGLSGAVYTLIGFAWTLTSFTNNSKYYSLRLPSGIMFVSLFWIMLGFLLPSFSMANGAHIGGIIMGILLGLYEIKFIKSKITS